MPDPAIPTFDRPLPRVDQPTFVNRATLCPVCLKTCDLQTQDVVPYFPVYLAPFDTLRAYDGFYHRACLYQVGDYERMVVAWHQGEKTLAPQATQMIHFGADLAALKRTPQSPLEILLFPRFARIGFTTRDAFEGFATGIRQYHKSKTKRRFAARFGTLEIRPVANQELMVLRWEIPLLGTLHFRTESLEQQRSPQEITKLLRGTKPIDLETLPAPTGAGWAGGDLEPGIVWDLQRLSGILKLQQKDDDTYHVQVRSLRLRFVPIWDEEVAKLVDLLDKHNAALMAAI